MTRFEQLCEKIYQVEMAARRCTGDYMRSIWLQKQYALEQQILNLTVDRASRRVK
jgi:hypothetical protein